MVALWLGIQAGLISFYWPLIIWWITVFVALGVFIILMITILFAFKEILRASYL